MAPTLTPAPRFVIVFRRGGTENFTWHRSLEMSRADADARAAEMDSPLSPAFVVNAQQSRSIGLPETF